MLLIFCPICYTYEYNSLLLLPNILNEDFRMRQKFTSQMSLFSPMARNSIVKELEQISNMIDDNPRLIDLVFDDIAGTSRTDTGRFSCKPSLPGLSVIGASPSVV